MRNVQMTGFLYRIVINLLLPFALIRLLWKSRNNSDYRKRIAERLAFKLPNTQDAIWIHTVSVGEFIATLPLIEKLLNDNQHILVTTTTPTGSAMVLDKLGNRVSHCYLPFDTRWIMRRFISNIQPSIAVFVETEIWPNAIHELKAQKVPSLLINARLSERSFNGYSKLGTFAEQTITNLTEIACQNMASQARFSQLSGHASTLGNIKFDLNPPSDLAEKQTLVKHIVGEQAFVMAASTHQGEESLILKAYLDSSESRALVIAPRHPERSNEVAQIAKKLNITYSRYTDRKPLTYITSSGKTPTKQLLIIDTLGQLLPFYSLCDYAIIGGSFIERGGHNPLEAALFGKPCQIGPHYFNFDSLVAEMKTKNAIEVVDERQLFQQAPLEALGQNAKRFLANNQGALEKYYQLILAHKVTSDS